MEEKYSTEIPLSNLVSKNDPLLILADTINWNALEKDFKKYYSSALCKPKLSIRLMIGLLILQYLYKYPDRKVVDLLNQNNNYQYLCGYEYFQNQCKVHPSSLTYFRKRMGEEGARKILEATIEVALNLHWTKLIT